jgi:ankyrin repeat protein
VIKLLLRHNTITNSTSDDEPAPFFLTLLIGNLEILENLLRREANVNPQFPPENRMPVSQEAVRMLLRDNARTGLQMDTQANYDSINIAFKK